MHLLRSIFATLISLKYLDIYIFPAHFPFTLLLFFSHPNKSLPILYFFFPFEVSFLYSSLFPFTLLKLHYWILWWRLFSTKNIEFPIMNCILLWSLIPEILTLQAAPFWIFVRNPSNSPDKYLFRIHNFSPKLYL